MDTNKGFVKIIISIIILAGVGGFIYYQNTKDNTADTSPDTENSINTETTSSTTSSNSSSNGSTLGLSPKEIFIKRITDTNNATSYDDIVKVMQKYDSSAQVAEILAEAQNANPEKKKALYTILQGFFPSYGELTNIKEIITGDTATVTADTRQSSMTAKFIKENGEWKISDLGGF